MFWRRIGGAGVMIIGGAAAVATLALAALVLVTRLEWDNAADALRTLAIITLPPLVGGLLLVVLGRFVYGEWSERAPVMRVTALIAQLAGLIFTGCMAGLFLLLLFAGVGPGDQQTAVALAAGMAIGVAVIFLGWRLKPSRRRSGKFLD